MNENLGNLKKRPNDEEEKIELNSFFFIINKKYEIVDEE